jgi:hypothetical protein
MQLPGLHIVGAMLFIALGAGSLPGLLSAQVSESVLLREQIRSTITADPRASELTRDELDTLVEALAGQVEVTGQTQDFVVPDVFYEEMVPFPAPEDRMRFSEAVIYGVVILSLGLVLLALRHAHELHHRKARA